MRSLRASGASWVEVSAALQQRYRLNARVALHYAHGTNRAFALLNRAQARIQQTEVTEASSIVADVAQLTAGHASQRIAQRITDLRGLLTPWKRTKPVRELDERLAAYPAVESSSKL